MSAPHDDAQETLRVIRAARADGIKLWLQNDQVYAAPRGDKLDRHRPALDKLYDAIAVVLEREPGLGGGAAPGDPAPEPEPETVHYSRGRDKYDAYPEQRTAACFAAFAEAVLADRSSAKGLTWIAAPFAGNNGRHHRCRDGAQRRRFLALDLDGATPEGFPGMCMWLAAFRGFGYTTASHTAESPHARYILELSRAVDRTEGLCLGVAMQRQIEAHLGPGAVKLDPSVYRGEQPVYGPLLGAETMRYDGDPVNVDEVLATAPAEPSRERPATPDPYRALIIEHGLLLRELGPGKDAITCPFAAEPFRSHLGHVHGLLLAAARRI